MKSVIAKFECISVSDDSELEVKSVALWPVTDGSEENKSFSKYTPSGSLNLVISYDTPACEFFKEGKEYYLDITEYD